MVGAGAANSDFMRLLVGGLSGCAAYAVLSAPMLRRVLPASMSGRAGTLLAAYDRIQLPLRHGRHQKETA